MLVVKSPGGFNLIVSEREREPSRIIKTHQLEVENKHAESPRFWQNQCKPWPFKSSKNEPTTFLFRVKAASFSAFQGLPDACDWVGLSIDTWDAFAEQIGGVADSRLEGVDGIDGPQVSVGSHG